MILKVFAVFDSKAATFGNPFPDQREASAIRNFSDAVNDGSNPNNLWHKHPEDFSLFYVGSFDTDTGALHPENPRALVTASAIRTLAVNTADLDFVDKNGKSVKNAVLDEAAQLDLQLKN